VFPFCRTECQRNYRKALCETLNISYKVKYIQSKEIGCTLYVNEDYRVKNVVRVSSAETIAISLYYFKRCANRKKRMIWNNKREIKLRPGGGSAS
jgi:hypothetical protein